MVGIKGTHKPECPECLNHDTTVIDVRETLEKRKYKRIRRRYACLDCRYRFTLITMLDDDLSVEDRYRNLVKAIRRVVGNDKRAYSRKAGKSEDFEK